MGLSMSKTLRNRILAFLCFLVFVAVGVLYYNNWVVQKPFGIILFTADGLTPAMLTSARIYGGGADNHLTLERFPHVSLLSNYSSDHAVPDTAAASSILATGVRVPNGSLSLGPRGEKLEGLVSQARKSGRLVGLVTNGSITTPGAAAFYTNAAPSPSDEALAAFLTENSPFDVLAGGGLSYFLPQHKDGKRKDNRDLTMELRQSGIDLVRNLSEWNNTPGWRAPNLIGLFADGPMPFADDVSRSAGKPTLSDLVSGAIRLLQFNPKGYLLVVDVSLPGEAASKNQGERTLNEILQLDAAVKTAIEYAGENSLILVVGRTNPGGLQLSGYPFRQDSGMALLGRNIDGLPYLAWASGPSIDPNQPAAAAAPAALPVASDVLGLGVGPGSEALEGFGDTTEVAEIIRKQL